MKMYTKLKISICLVTQVNIAGQMLNKNLSHNLFGYQYYILSCVHKFPKNLTIEKQCNIPSPRVEPACCKASPGPPSAVSAASVP